MSLFQLNELPLEMLDIILQKSYRHWIFNSLAKQKDEEAIRSLIAVDVCFNRRITRKRFKNEIWRYLKGEMSSNHHETMLMAIFKLTFLLIIRIAFTPPNSSVKPA